MLKRCGTVARAWRLDGHSNRRTQQHQFSADL